jgi:hypothetical protein
LANSITRPQSFFLNPYFISFCISLTIILLLPDFFHKYQLKLSESGILERQDAVFRYDDLDYDGFSEQIEAFNNSSGNTTVKVTNYKGLIIDQWFFSGQLTPRWIRFFTADFDNSGNLKIFIFTQKNDSLFLNCAMPRKPGKYFKEIFITGP